MRSRRPFIRRTCCVSARPSSQGTPPCLSEVSGDAPVPPSCPEIRTDVRMRLRDARRHCADAGNGDQFDRNPGARIRVFQIVNELRQIFNRVDVVVRRRRDQPDARR